MPTTSIFAYGALGFPLAFAALPIYVHLPRYYAATTGMELALLGAILLGARLVDAVIDPWLGWLADRLPRRRMLAVALLPFAFGFLALFNPPQDGAVPWLIGALTLTYLGFSAASVAYQAWGAAIGTSSGLRTRLTAAREGLGLAGVVLAAVLPSLLSSDLSIGTERLSWLLPPVLAVAALAAFAGIGGESCGPVTEESLWGSLQRSWRDAAFRRLLVVFVANGIAAALPATLFLFFVADVLQAAAFSGVLLTLYFVAGAASLPLWVRLSSRLGRVRAWAIAMLLAMLAFAGAGSLAAGDVALFTLICVASGLALGADLALPAAIAADLGERQGLAGAYFGIWNLVSKLNLALAAGVALPLLSMFGYRPTGASVQGGLAALSLTYALLPLAFKLLAAALLWRWRDSLEIRS